MAHFEQVVSLNLALLAFGNLLKFIIRTYSACFGLNRYVKGPSEPLSHPSHESGCCHTDARKTEPIYPGPSAPRAVHSPLRPALIP